MKLFLIIFIGLLVGVLSNILTTKTDLGKFGNILACIVGATTGYFTIDTLGLTSLMGNTGIFFLTSFSAIIFLYLMKKVSRAF